MSATGTQFPLMPNSPPIRTMIRWLRGMAVLGLVVVWCLFAARVFDIVDALMMSAFSIAFAAMTTWGFRRAGKGTVQLTRDGIFVWGHGRRGKVGYNYEWKDIAEVRLVTPRGYIPRDWVGARMGIVDEKPAFVEIRLTRPLLPLIPDRWGTLWAIRGLGSRTVKLYVADPQGLVRAAQPFLTRSAGAGRV